MALAMFFTACEKDNNGLVTLTAEINNYHSNGNTKMNVDANNYTHWTSGDAVNINGTSNTCSVALGSGNAKITGVPSSTSGYLAVYPAGIASNYNANSTSITVTLPSSQTYSMENGKQIIQAPMCGYCANGSNTLTFHNLCSLLKVTVNNDRTEDITMQRITITSSNKALSGSGKIYDPRTSSPYLTVTGNKYVILDFSGSSETITQGTNKSYYIVVPSFTSSNISIAVEASSSSVMDITKTHNSAVMAANVIATGPTINMNDAVIDFLGLGTESNPFQINTKTDLELLRTRVNAGKLYDGKYFKLMDDIPCGSSWTGIGSFSNKFNGIFDGNGNTISYSQTNPGSYGGLFKTAGTATFKNLNIDCLISNAGLYSGGIVGYSTGANFQNCEVTGSISGSNKRYGGITGSLVNTAGTISHCTSSITITSTVSGEALLGGIVGDVGISGSLVEYCSASGDITAATGTKIGGIAGSLSSGCTIDNCTYTGTATGSSLTNPIVGNKGGTVTNCIPADQNN